MSERTNIEPEPSPESYPETSFEEYSESKRDESWNQDRRRTFWSILRDPKVIAPIVVLVAGALSAKALMDSRQAPPREDRPALGPLVEAVEVSPSDLQISIEAEGEVSPSISVELLSEVSGRVIEVHPSLVAGGRFRAGQVLVRIDPRDYELAVDRAKAAVARAQVSLEREKAEAEAARAEWQALEGDQTPPPLLVRDPQIRQARAEVAAAEADLATARLALDRTRLSLPFDGIVISETVDPGQLLPQGRSVARVYGTEAVEIRLPLADGELAWLDLGESLLGKGRGQGPKAEVRAEIFGQKQTWTGRVERLEGQVDPRSRVVHLVVKVDRPFDGEVPLMPGTFVEVAIEGKQLQQVFEIPRHALRGDDQVWIERDGVLEVRRVEVARKDRHRAYVREGLDAGDRLVVSSLDVATDGMSVRAGSLAEDSPRPAAPAATPADTIPADTTPESAS